MFKKKVLKFLDRLFDNDYAKILFYLLGFIGIFTLWRVFNSEAEFLPALIDILQGDIAISIFVAGLFSILFKHVLMMLDNALEESQKTDDDHHHIIQLYDGHDSRSVDVSENYYDKRGNYLAVHSTADRIPRNPIRDKKSSDYDKMEKEIALYAEHSVLRLPTVNVFTNILGNCSLRFVDSTEVGEIPSYIINNAGAIFKAHSHSRTTNNSTVRLKDFSLENNIVTLYTERSSYYRMLLTNRCMDFELQNGMTVRTMYEYHKTVTPLDESKMSNQIGINGTIVTSDGYLLIEKRDRKKTTWKNKFAQPISLALKESDLCERGKRTIGDTFEEANKRMLGVIKKTVKSNFGLTEEDYGELSFANNFMGIARDVLEGGKPNLFFSVTVNYTAKELLEKLRENAAKTGENAIKREKLAAEYYLVPFDKMKFNFNYEMKLKLSDIYRVDRWVAPRIHPAKVFLRRAVTKLHDAVNRYTNHECGEALLVGYAYLELCRERLPELQKTPDTVQQEETV